MSTVQVTMTGEKEQITNLLTDAARSQASAADDVADAIARRMSEFKRLRDTLVTLVNRYQACAANLDSLCNMLEQAEPRDHLVDDDDPPGWWEVFQVEERQRIAQDYSREVMI